MTNIRSITLFLAGLIIGAMLVVYDEILTLAMYCGRDCQYPYPFIGKLSLYDAEILGFAVIVSCILLMLIATTSRNNTN